jgi:hypothetical protein
MRADEQMIWWLVVTYQTARRHKRENFYLKAVRIYVFWKNLNYKMFIVPAREFNCQPLYYGFSPPIPLQQFKYLCMHLFKLDKRSKWLPRVRSLRGTYKMGIGLDDWIYCTLHLYTTGDYMWLQSYRYSTHITTHRYTRARILSLH